MCKKESGLYDQMIGRYPVVKTLGFGLEPVGETARNIKENGVIGRGAELYAKYLSAKKLCDRYYKKHIAERLSDVTLTGLDEYLRLLSIKEKTSEEEDRFKKSKEALRKQVSEALLRDKPVLDGKAFIDKVMVEFLEGDEESIALLGEFKGLLGYFTNYFKNRMLLFSPEEKHGAISYRVIDQNLPKFVDNMRVLDKALEVPSLSNLETDIEADFADVLCGQSLREFFDVNNYGRFLTQKGIDDYNTIVGGISVSEEKRIQGINERINLYNQTLKDKKGSLGLCQKLYSQLLSDSQTRSFRFEAIESAEGCLDLISSSSVLAEELISEFQALISDLDRYDPNGIYLDGKKINGIAKSVYGDWAYVRNAFNEAYDEENATKRRSKKYYATREKLYKNMKHISLGRLSELCGDEAILEYLKNEVSEKVLAVEVAKAPMKRLLDKAYPENKSLQQDDHASKIIRDYMEALKEFRRFISSLRVPDAPEKDAAFYGVFLENCDDFDFVNQVYNRVRNYITKKPYSEEKIPITFDIPDLMGGWAPSKFGDRGSVILLKDGKYYLLIANKADRKFFKYLPDAEEGESSYALYEKPNIPNVHMSLPRWLIVSNEAQENLGVDDDFVAFYKSYVWKENEADLHRLIDHYKRTLPLHESSSIFDFDLKPTEEYHQIKDFYQDISSQGFQASFRQVSEKAVHDMVNEGMAYLFEITCRDFSASSRGRKSLNTKYFEMIFDERNMKEKKIDLCGGGKIFYRKASIDKSQAVVHKANEGIATKNPLNEKKERRFAYDIVKDRRYTEDKFMLNLSVKINPTAEDRFSVNEPVRKHLRDNGMPYIVGVNRGERNLLYVVVLSPEGKIVEQRSLNIISNVDPDGNLHKTDYKEMLQQKESLRDKQRKSWQSIDKIADIKQGYLSHAVHEITELMRKYDALLVMEKFSDTFYRGRQKIERQVYRKFEEMLLKKLNYLADKKLPDDVDGGIMYGYQLSNKFSSFEKVGTQCGVVFFAAPSYITGIDPVTGFVNLFDTRYSTREEARAFFSKFDNISYDEDLGMFRFDFDFANFTYRLEGTKRKWTIYTNGERIQTARNRDGQFVTEHIDLTSTMASLLRMNEISPDPGRNLVPDICAQNDKFFLENMLNVVRLTVQMRNAIPNSEIDYIISPVMSDGKFFDSRDVKDGSFPVNMDCAGAYHLAQKCRMMVGLIQEGDEELVLRGRRYDAEKGKWVKATFDLFIDNESWLGSVQGA